MARQAFSAALATKGGTGTGSGSGSSGSRLSRTTAGRLFAQNYLVAPDAVIGTSADSFGWFKDTVRGDLGTFKYIGGLWVSTGGANNDHARNLTPNVGSAVWEMGLQTPTPGTGALALLTQVGTNLDTFMLYGFRNNLVEIDQRSAGTWGSSTTHTGATMLADKWNRLKVVINTSTKQPKIYTNRALDSQFNGSFTISDHLTTSGGVGLYQFGAVANSIISDIAIYSSLTLTLAGLSGTQAFRLLDRWGNQVVGSSAQSSGTATVDLGAVADCPFAGIIELHASTAFSSLIAGGRYPVEGYVADIFGGDTYTYV